MDQRTLDRLVKSIVDELDKRDIDAGSQQSRDSSGAVALVDQWRIRAQYRDEFLDFYLTHVANVMKTLDGYLDGRVYTSPSDAPYSWHVQAYYEFRSADIVGRFRKDFDRGLRAVKSGMTMDKVLDAMDPWVLAHEDGVLQQVWR